MDFRNYYRRIIILLFLTGLIFALTSCAVVGEHWVLNSDGKMVLVEKLKLNRAGKLKKGDMELDTRERSFWEKNILPAVAGVAQRTEAVAPI